VNVTLLKGYPDFIGKRQAWAGYGNGPASYVQGGDPLILPQYGAYLDTIDSSSLSVSQNYSVVGLPSGVGPRKSWKLKWLYAGGQIGVNSFSVSSVGSGQTAGTYNIGGTGGTGATGFGGATIGIVIAGGVIVSAVLVSPGQGYFTVPTFTVNAGGTPGTIASVSLGMANGAEVAAGTNLSAEQVQIGGFCGQF